MKEKELTGYPSIDKPWLKYYSEEVRNAKVPACSMYDLLYGNNCANTGDIAVEYMGNKVTYGRLFGKIEEAARAFWAWGIRKGDIVAICAVNIPEVIYSIYALNRIGAIVNLIDPRSNMESIKSYIRECDAKAVVTIDIAYSAAKEAAREEEIDRVIVMSAADSMLTIEKALFQLQKIEICSEDLDWKKFVSQGEGAEPIYAAYEKNRCVILAHTGGTTGTPKTVMLSNDCINAVAAGYRYLDVPFERQQKYFNDLPPFIIYGLTVGTHVALCYGLHVIVYPIFDSKGFPKLMKKYKPNHFSALPDHLKYVMESTYTKDMDLSFLISSGVGGDKLNEELEREVNKFLKEHNCPYEVCKGYGMTELSATAINSSKSANQIGSVGIPLIFNSVKIMNIDDGGELGYDETGEIWISGPSIFLGYWGNEEETKKIIVVEKDGTRWIKTGDIGRISKEGLLFHEGRIRRIYLTVFEGQPAKIFPTMVEDAIKSSPLVYDCAVVARHMKNSEYYEPVAYVILKNPDLGEETTEKLRKICRDKLPSYMQPVDYYFVDEFPHIPIGKVDHKKLEAMEENADGLIYLEEGKQ